jgi:cell wall-associated NlpC family hydrolase
MKILSPHRFGRLIIVASSFTMVLPAVIPEIAQASVGEQRREVERIVDQLDRLETQADILAEDYAEAVDQKNQLDIEIIAAEGRVADKEAELTGLRGDLAEVAIRAFTGNGADVLGPLFSDANQYSEGLRRDQYSRVALSVGTSTTDDLDELISDLEAERKDLESKRAQAEALTIKIADKQQQTETLTAQYIEQRGAAERRLGQLIQEEEERRAAAAYAKLQADFAAQQAANAAASAAANTGGGTTGGGTTGGGDTGGGTSTGGGGGDSTPSAPAPAANIPSVSGRAGIAIEAARGQLGVRYVYATSKPGVSFDCSGLTHYAWGQAGVYLPRNSRSQAAALPRVPAASAQPGDLIFYYSPISHVGIYLGGSQILHAPNSGTVVKISSVSWGKVTAVGRPG